MLRGENGKKEGYDWVTNTYCINDGGACGCLITLFFIGAIVSAFFEWYDDHTGLFWGIIIALVVLIILLVRRNKAKKKMKEVEAAKEAQKERDEAQKAQKALVH